MDDDEEEVVVVVVDPSAIRYTSPDDPPMNPTLAILLRPFLYAGLSISPELLADGSLTACEVPPNTSGGGGALI